MPTTWRRALVTGASSGIGAAFADLLAEAGTDLVLVARSQDRLEANATRLRAQYGREVEVLTADLTDPSQRTTVEERLSSEDAPVDLLVNNAGFGTSGRFASLDLSDEISEIDLNVVAVMRLTHAALRRMRPAGHGGVLNVSSLGGFQPLPFMSTYAATKAFVISFTEAIHEELAGTGVHATVLCPGFTRTGFQAAADVEKEASRLPAPLWQEPDEAARAGLAGVAANRAVVVPGVANRAAAMISRVSPPSVTRRFLGIVQRGL